MKSKQIRFFFLSKIGIKSLVLLGLGVDLPSFLRFIIFPSSDTFWVKHRELKLRFFRLKKQETILDVSPDFCILDELFLLL